MEDVRNSIPWKKPFIPKTGKEESNTNRKPETVQISNHLHLFQAIIFQILKVMEWKQQNLLHTDRRDANPPTTILGLEETTLMYY